MSYEKNIADAVAANGWTAISVSDHEPPFVYTVGLMFCHEHPELIVLGLPGEGYGVLAAMVQDIAGGRSFADATTYEGVLAEGSIATRPVHRTQQERYLGYAMGYCRERGRIGELQAVQVFWPDDAGVFPFEPGCDQEIWSLQPRLDLPFHDDE